MWRLPQAEAMARRAVASNPKATIAYWNLAEAQVGQHRFAAAESTAALIATHLPESAYRYFIAASIMWGRRDLDALESYIRSPGARLPSGGAMPRCLLDLHRGRIRAWQGCPLRDGLVYQNPMLIMAEFRLTGDSARARTGYEAFLAAAPNERNPDRYPTTIALLADAGRVREARQLLDEWRARSGSSDPGFRGDSAQAVGALAAAENNWTRRHRLPCWNSRALLRPCTFTTAVAGSCGVLSRVGQGFSDRTIRARAATSSLYGGEIYEAGWYARRYRHSASFTRRAVIARSRRVLPAFYGKLRMRIRLSRRSGRGSGEAARVTGEPARGNR